MGPAKVIIKVIMTTTTFAPWVLARECHLPIADISSCRPTPADKNQDAEAMVGDGGRGEKKVISMYRAVEELC